MLLFGVVMALLGAVLPVVSARLKFDLAQAGQLFLAMNFCMLAASLSLGPLMDRFGLKPPLLGGPLVVGAALILIALAPDYPVLLAGAALLGLGGGALNAGANTLVADLHPEPSRKNAALNLLGVFFGFGALLLPFAVGALLARVGLVAIALAVAAGCAAASVFSLTLAFPAPKQAGGVKAADVWRFARMPAVLLVAFLLFFQSGNEFTLGGYLSMYLTREVGSSIAGASYGLAGFWAAIMLARLLLSRILLRVEGHTLVLLSASCSAGATALLLLLAWPVGAFGAVVLLGLSLAGIYPTMLGIAGARFKENSGTVFGILFTIALAGGMTLPWLVGQIAQRQGLRTALWLVTGSFLLILALAFRIRRLYRRERLAGTD